MVDPTGTTIFDLKDDLLENGREFDFFQAYRLLLRLNRVSTRSRFEQRDIRVRPNLELGYDDTDVHAVHALDGDKGFEIVTNLAGLYGISSPLPDFYTEELLDYEWDGQDGPRAFLDILHHQLLDKLYHAWRLYRLGQNTVEDRQKSYQQLLASLTNNPTLNDDIDDELSRFKLQFSGLFTLYSKSALGLKTLVRAFLQLPHVRVEQNAERQVRIPDRDRLRLGERSTCLGEDAHLGSQVADRSGAVRIQVGPMSEHHYRKHFLDESRLNLLARLIHEYLVEPLAIQFELLLDLPDAGTQLGSRWNRLGETSYLTHPEEHNLTRIFIDL